MTRRPAGPTGLDALDEITSRLGGLGDALKTAIGAVSEAAAKAERGEGGAFTIDAGKGPVEVRSGFHVRVGGLAGDGAPRSDDFEVRDLNAGKAAAETPSAAGAPPRAPLVDVFDEADAWVVTAELPGVAEAHLTVAATAAGLSIAAAGPRPYATTVPLPPGLDPARLSHRLANGILEVRIAKGTGA